MDKKIWIEEEKEGTWRSTAISFWWGCTATNRRRRRWKGDGPACRWRGEGREDSRMENSDIWRRNSRSTDSIAQRLHVVYRGSNREFECTTFASSSSSSFFFLFLPSPSRYAEKVFDHFQTKPLLDFPVSQFTLDKTAEI